MSARASAVGKQSYMDTARFAKLISLATSAPTREIVRLTLEHQFVALGRLN
jgi:hypothetical protein